MYDLIVVGAGPAGSAAAGAAAQLGLKTLILEKEVFPRYKPCGGAVSEKVVSILDYPLPEDLCERKITGARVHYQDLAREGHKSYRLATLVSRSRFDHHLLQKAEGAGSRLETQKVLGYREGDDYVAVQTKTDVYRSRFLVIASGYQDPLKQRIAGRETQDRFGICLVTEIEEDDCKIDQRLHETLDVHFGVASMGYGWIFPHLGYYSVGIGGLADRLHHPKEIMRQFLKRNGFAGQYRLHGHLIPLGGVSRRIASSRVLLAGDSAGFVDGFTGEGIYYAIRSGQIASNAVSEKLGQDGMDLARVYSARCQEDFGHELWYALQLSRLMHSRPEMLLRALINQGSILERYMDVLAGRSDYQKFARWMVPRIPLSLLRSFLPVSRSEWGAVR